MARGVATNVRFCLVKKEGRARVKIHAFLVNEFRCWELCWLSAKKV